MPRKVSPIITVGTRDWEVTIPRPPKRATHARMIVHNDMDGKGKPKSATLPIQDFGCFKGVYGDFYYLRMDNKRKIVEEWEKDVWHWDGLQVRNLPELEK